jgi:hypothetical protein
VSKILIQHSRKSRRDSKEVTLKTTTHPTPITAATTPHHLQHYTSCLTKTPHHLRHYTSYLTTTPHHLHHHTSCLTSTPHHLHHYTSCLTTTHTPITQATSGHNHTTSAATPPHPLPHNAICKNYTSYTTTAAATSYTSHARSTFKLTIVHPLNQLHQLLNKLHYSLPFHRASFKNRHKVRLTHLI